jgi:isochorismate synthase
MTDVAARPAALTGAQAVARYRPGDSRLFASRRGVILGEGTAAQLPGWVTADALPDRVAGLLDDAAANGHPDPVAVGALAFDPALPAHLVVPETVLRAAPLGPFTGPAGTTARPAVGDPEAVTIRSRPEPDDFVAAVGEAVAHLRATKLRKVVLARCLEIAAAERIDVAAVLANLVRRDPAAYAFALDVPRGPGGGERTLVGASPELLVRRIGDRVVANPLAGSAPRAGDPAEDERRAHALLRSEKDRDEHALVVESVRASLAPLCGELTVPTEPALVSTATMWHLSTTVTGTVADASVSSLALAQALHPTPAICGVPVPRARALIERLEPFSRGFYAGMVGWCDGSGDGEWAVTIRCGVAEGATMALYAGAGIVAASTPELELAETAAKARTLLAAMGLER